MISSDDPIAHRRWTIINDKTIQKEDRSECSRWCGFCLHDRKSCLYTHDRWSIV